jgi:hypothetical protein
MGNTPADKEFRAARADARRVERQQYDTTKRCRHCKKTFTPTQTTDVFCNADCEGLDWERRQDEVDTPTDPSTALDDADGGLRQ